MKRILRATIFITFICVSTLYSAYKNGIAATVNGKVITRYEVDELVSYQIFRDYQKTKIPPTDRKINKYRKEAIDELVGKVLILDFFQKKGLEVPEYYLESGIKKFIKDNFKGNRKKFLRELKKQQLSLAQFKEIEKEKLIVETVKAQHIKRSPIILPMQKKSFYRKNLHLFRKEGQVKLRMITLPKYQSESGGNHQTQKAVGKKIIKDIKSGKKFSKLAKKHSADFYAKDGGDWGWISNDSLNPYLTSIAFDLRVGVPSKLAEDGKNYYILYVEKKRDGAVIPYARVKKDVERRLLAQKREKFFQKWLKKQKKRAYIQVY